jgi:hypothetical protein
MVYVPPCELGPGLGTHKHVSTRPHVFRTSFLIKGRDNDDDNNKKKIKKKLHGLTPRANNSVALVNEKLCRPSDRRLSAK